MDETLLSSYLAFSLSYVAAVRSDQNLAEKVTPLIERLVDETLGKMEKEELVALEEEVRDIEEGGISAMDPLMGAEKAERELRDGVESVDDLMPMRGKPVVVGESYNLDRDSTSVDQSVETIIHKVDSGNTIHEQSTGNTIHKQSTENTIHEQSTENTIHKQSTENTIHEQSTENTIHKQSTENTIHEQSIENTIHKQSIDSPPIHQPIDSTPLTLPADSISIMNPQQPTDSTSIHHPKQSTSIHKPLHSTLHHNSNSTHALDTYTLALQAFALHNIHSNRYVLLATLLSHMQLPDGSFPAANRTIMRRPFSISSLADSFGNARVVETTALVGRVLALESGLFSESVRRIQSYGISQLRVRNRSFFGRRMAFSETRKEPFIFCIS